MYKVSDPSASRPSRCISCHLIPLVEKNGAWHFDPVTGLKEVVFRRIGENELTAIAICHELAAYEKTAEYRSSGVMTFLITANDVVRKKDLGANSSALASRLALSHEDSGWVPSEGK